jgi:hypothetical protein
VGFGCQLAFMLNGALPVFNHMAGFAHDAQQDFWQSPASAEPTTGVAPSVSAKPLADACKRCGSEFLIGAKFCHVCGRGRALAGEKSRVEITAIGELWSEAASQVQPWIRSVACYWRKTSFPDWLQYLHFHEIKRRVGLPTASLIAFMIGLGCVAGAIGVSLFYSASTLAEFQAIQMWRIEWLLAATASFVAGILLKNPSNPDRN